MEMLLKLSSAAVLGLLFSIRLVLAVTSTAHSIISRKILKYSTLTLATKKYRSTSKSSQLRALSRTIFIKLVFYLGYV